MNGYQILMSEFKMGFDDPWGDTMSWWFATAEVLYHNGVKLPDEWEFSDSPMHPSSADEWDHEYGWNTDDLLRFGKVLTRYATLLKTAGKDY